MCGIGGIVLRPGGHVRSEWLAALDRVLAHRGPDDRGFLAWDDGQLPGRGREPGEAGHGRLALVHRRLSIIDPGPSGWQPMVSPDGRHAIVFNGEVYNFIELKAELEALGDVFAGRSDTEVVLAAWRRWGESALPRLVGMFAFAVVDFGRREIVLARDRFGIKPLYLAQWGGGIAFASEIPALLELPGMSRCVDAQAAHRFLAHGLTDRPDGRTLFAAVRSLPPGTMARISLDDPAPAPAERFATVAADAPSQLGFAEAARRLRELFMDSVGLHLRSDVAVGAALSGGIDSSAIVMAMRSIAGAGDLHVFSFQAPGTPWDEGPWARQVAAVAGARMHAVVLDPSELGRDLDALVSRQGEPFVSTSILAQWKVYEAARRAGITVVLDGQGADEMLAGYPAYRAARLASAVAGHDPVTALRLAAVAGPADIVRAAGLLLPAGMARFARRLAGRGTPSWLDRRWFADRGVDIDPPPLPRRRGLLHDRLEHSLVDVSLPALLRYSDRNSMSHSVESRVPFLTPALAGFILSLPQEYLVDDGGTSKSVFRAAMRGLVPDTVLDRRDKVGFVTPEAQWIKALAPWAEDKFHAKMCPLPMIDAKKVEPMIADALHGRSAWRQAHWRIVAFAAWSRCFGVEG
ncbi:MAG: asparagine synthase (glutamine-hydrolyzing) [Pseudomonadota bacterium]